MKPDVIITHHYRGAGAEMNLRYGADPKSFIRYEIRHSFTGICRQCGEVWVTPASVLRRTGDAEMWNV